MNIERLTLPNGLRVIHHRDQSAAMAAVNVLYDVGARDESAEMTGIAHLFEHLMFGGSVNIPDFDAPLESAGGTSNAWTGNDFTNFYDILPAHNIETAFWLESDRMISPSLTEESVAVQKNVVIEEFKQTSLNRPYGDTMHHLRAMAYKVHPYRWPVIGISPEQIAAVTPEDARRFFMSHYGPSTAVLSVSGNVDTDRVFRLAEKWFGDIPGRVTVPRKLPAEPDQTEARRLTVTADVPATTLTIAYKMSGRNAPQYPAADILTDILASGRSSYFYRDLLLKTGLFTEIDASILGCEDPGLLLINARLTGDDDRTVADAEKVITDNLERIVRDGIPERRLQRALNRYESNLTFSNISVDARTAAIAMAEMQGEHPDENLRRYRRLTADDINRAAADIFRPEKSSTLLYKPLRS